MRASEEISEEQTRQVRHSLPPRPHLPNRPLVCRCSLTSRTPTPSARAPRAPRSKRPADLLPATAGSSALCRRPSDTFVSHKHTSIPYPGPTYPPSQTCCTCNRIHEFLNRLELATDAATHSALRSLMSSLLPTSRQAKASLHHHPLRLRPRSPALPTTLGRPNQCGDHQDQRTALSKSNSGVVCCLQILFASRS